MTTINKELLLQTVTDLANKYAQFHGEDMEHQAAFYARVAEQLKGKLEQEQA